MQKDFTKSFLVFGADLSFLQFTARKYKASALQIKNGDYGSCSPAFHLLSSLAFELFPKVILGHEICLKYKDDSIKSEEEIIEEISNEMRKYTHNLASLYNHFPEIIKFLDIEKISEFKNGYVWDYRIKLNHNDNLILIKNIEAARYVSFAKNKDIMMSCSNDHAIVDLLEKLEKYTERRHEETAQILKH